MASCNKSILVDESANGGVIVAGLEVVQLRVDIVVIAPVPERVVVGHMVGGGRQRRPGGVLHRQQLAPGIVLVGTHQIRLPRLVPVVHGHHIPLDVLYKVIICPGALIGVLYVKAYGTVALVKGIA